MAEQVAGRDGAQSRAEDGEWQHQELYLWQQAESETGGDDGLEKRTWSDEEAAEARRRQWRGGSSGEEAAITRSRQPGLWKIKECPEAYIIPF